MCSSRNDWIVRCARCLANIYRLPNFDGATVTVSAREDRTRDRGDAFLLLDLAAGKEGQGGELTAKRLARKAALPSKLTLT